jgi:hypothetical protein
MNKTDEVIAAFLRGEKGSHDATMSTGTALYLHGSKLVEGPVDGSYLITFAGFDSNKTRDRINAFLTGHAGFRAAGVRVARKAGGLVLSGDYRVTTGNPLNSEGLLAFGAHDILKISTSFTGVTVEVSE